MKILICGACGAMGRAVAAVAREYGHEPVSAMSGGEDMGYSFGSDSADSYGNESGGEPAHIPEMTVANRQYIMSTVGYALSVHRCPHHIISGNLKGRFCSRKIALQSALGFRIYILHGVFIIFHNIRRNALRLILSKIVRKFFKGVHANGFIRNGYALALTALQQRTKFSTGL